jgi:hypothetical protein
METSFITAIVGIILGLIYFVQQHSLQKNRMIFDLFREFNKRYDDLNDRLNDYVQGNGGVDEIAVIDYLNLSAEEYYFYRRGCIPKDVWREWVNGIIEKINIPKVREIWIREVRYDNYYGIKLEIENHLKARSDNLH